MLACGLPCVELDRPSTRSVFGADGPVTLADFDPAAIADGARAAARRRGRVGAALAGSGASSCSGQSWDARRRAGRARAAQRAAGARWLGPPSCGRPPALGRAAGGQPLLAVTWAACCPAFQAPDEQSHFTLRADRSPSATRCPASPSRPFFSTAAERGHRGRQLRPGRRAAARSSPSGATRSSATGRRPQAQAPRDDGGGPGPAYRLPADRVRVAGDRLRRRVRRHAVRRAARRAADVGAVAAGHGARDVAARGRGARPPARCCRRPPRRCPRWLPMFTFISASVSPDGMMYALWTLALWLGVRCVKRGVPLARRRRVLRAGRARLHGQDDELRAAPGGAVRRRARPAGAPAVADRRRAARWPPRSSVAARAHARRVGARRRGEDRPAAAQVHRVHGGRQPAGTNWRELLSYVWQYYLPRAAVPAEVPASRPAAIRCCRSGSRRAGRAFGWLEVKFAAVGLPGARRRSRWASSPAALAALVRARRRDRPARRSASSRSPSWRCSAACTGPTTTSSRPARAGFMQGRYLFPVIGIFGARAGRRRLAAAGAAARRRRPARRSPACSSSTCSRSAWCWSGSMRRLRSSSSSSGSPRSLAVGAHAALEPRLLARRQPRARGGRARRRRRAPARRRSRPPSGAAFDRVGFHRQPVGEATAAQCASRCARRTADGRLATGRLEPGRRLPRPGRPARARGRGRAREDRRAAASCAWPRS